MRIYLLLICLYCSCQCTTEVPSRISVVEQSTSKRAEEWRDTLELTEVTNCEQIATVSLVALAYDTFTLSIAFKDTSRKDRVVSINNVRSDLVRVVDCTPEYLELKSACSGACWKTTIVFFDDQQTTKNYSYAQRVSGASNLIVHRAHGEPHFEKMTLQDLKTGKKALIERYDCFCFQEMDLTMDAIYVEGDSIVFVCDEEYGKAKVKSLAYTDLQ